MAVRRDGRRVALAGVLLGIFAVTMAWVVLHVDNGRAAGADLEVLDMFLALAWMAFPAVGAVIVWH
ncbi:MAG: hypothetical protein M3Q68_07075, partial [Actinomycetota bacterium]|nr:hypothetical protein [Actinomycetota bacterium]